MKNKNSSHISREESLELLSTILNAVSLDYLSKAPNITTINNRIGKPYREGTRYKLPVLWNAFIFSAAATIIQNKSVDSLTNGELIADDRTFSAKDRQTRIADAKHYKSVFPIVFGIMFAYWQEFHPDCTTFVELKKRVLPDCDSKMLTPQQNAELKKSQKSRKNFLPNQITREQLKTIVPHALRYAHWYEDWLCRKPSKAVTKMTKGIIRYSVFPPKAVKLPPHPPLPERTITLLIRKALKEN